MATTERKTDIGPPHYEQFLPPIIKANYVKWDHHEIVEPGVMVHVGLILLMAFTALIMVRRIQTTPAHAGEKLTVGVFFRHFVDLREIYRSRPVWLSSIGIAVFWFTGAFSIAVFTQIAQEAYPIDGATAAAVASYCLAATGLGIAAKAVECA